MGNQFYNEFDICQICMTYIHENEKIDGPSILLYMMVLMKIVTIFFMNRVLKKNLMISLIMNFHSNYIVVIVDILENIHILVFGKSHFIKH